MPIIQQVYALHKDFQVLLPFQRRCYLCHQFGVHAHGSYRRYRPSGPHVLAGVTAVPRFLCLHCKRTFSLLPWPLLRRVCAPLTILLFIAQAKSTWVRLSERLGIAWNTLWAWKRLGKALLDKLPLLLTPGASWATLSLHLSRWQYPNGLRKSLPTIP